MAATAETIRLAPIPRTWFRIASIGCLVLAVVMPALLLGGGVAAAAFVLVFDLALAALAFGIARSTVVLGPGSAIVVTNGYRRRSIDVEDVERVDVVRSGMTTAPRRAALALANGSRIQLLATDGAGRPGDQVEALAAQVEAFVRTGAAG